jgi:DNA-binding MarR family transcriptional regulator
VSRKGHPTDSRMPLISLTATGVEMIRKLAPIAWERQKRLLSGLSQRRSGLLKSSSETPTIF